VAVYRDLDGEGIAMLLSAKGYDASNPISIAVGFDNDGNIEGVYVISATGETKGIGSKVKNSSFLDQFVGKSDVDEVDTISGATISSNGVHYGVYAALEQFKEVGGVN
jgi:electron transport complex protein RnfG